MLKTILSIVIALNLQISIMAKPVQPGVSPTKAAVLAAVFPGGEVKQSDKGFGEFIVVGGRDDIDDGFYTDLIERKQSKEKLIWKCHVLSANLFGKAKDAVIALVLYDYDGVSKPECCAQALKLFVLSNNENHLKLVGSFDFEKSLYMGNFSSIELHDLDGDGRDEIFVHHTESAVLQNGGKKLAILSFVNGKLVPLWYDYMAYNSVGSGRVPDESEEQKFERKFDLDKTKSEGGKTLYFEKKVTVANGVKLEKPDTMSEKKPGIKTTR